MAADLIPACSFLEVFRDKSEHHAGKDKDDNEDDTHQNGVLPHSSFNGLLLVVHVCECVCVCDVGMCGCVW